jgi:hypothetical protein
MRNAIRYKVTVPLQIGGLRLAAGSVRLAEGRQPCPGEPKALAVEVIYTTDEGTKHALRKAWALAQDLGAHVRLVFVYAVPYTLSLGKPAVSLPFLQNKLVKLASDFPGNASVHIVLCREALRALQGALPQTSLVILGGRRRWWWPTKGQRMEEWLKKMGHQVIFAETG